MALLTNQNYVSVSPPVIRVKLSFHSNEDIPLPDDTWHLLEFAKTPLVTDIVELIKFKFQIAKKCLVSLQLRGATFLKSEKSHIFRDEDTITVNVTSHTRQHEEQNTNKKVRLNQPIKIDSVKRKTAVAGSPPNLQRQQPIGTECSAGRQPVDSESSSSSSSSQSDQEKSSKPKPSLFIPRQVQSDRTATNQNAAKPPPNQLSNHKSDSSSSSSSEADSVDLQPVLRGAKHVRFYKQPKQPIRLRPRGRGRAFGRVPPELANRMGPPPPVGRRRIVSADTDTLRTTNVVLTNPQQEAETIKPDFSHLPAVTTELPPKHGAVIVFKVIELTSDSSPAQSDFRTAKVLSYDPSNQTVELEYVAATLETLKLSQAQMNEGKFGMEEQPNCVPSCETFNFNQLIDPRIMN